MEQLKNIEHPLTQSSKDVKNSDDYSNIDLDDSEREEAIIEAKKKKYFKKKHEEYWKSVTVEKKYPVYNAEQLRDSLDGLDIEMDGSKFKFVIDQENETVVWLLCLYFANDKRFEETEGFSLEKGLCLFGGIGVGKTILMNCFEQNQKLSYITASCREVESIFMRKTDDGGGDKAIQRFSHDFHSAAMNSNPYGHRVLGICFDDLGTESAVVKYYGTDKTIMTDIILNRYDKRLAFCKTHITTNLSGDEIRARYGSRAADRMRQMFNFIEFADSAKSRRK